MVSITIDGKSVTSSVKGHRMIDFTEELCVIVKLRDMLAEQMGLSFETANEIIIESLEDITKE